jgi:hypothetical protein
MNMRNSKFLLAGASALALSATPDGLNVPVCRLPRRTKDGARLMRGFTRDSAAGRSYTATTFDRATIDSTGSFLVSQLERLDPVVNEPLVAYTWSRDIDIRADVGIGDELASWTNSNFAAVGGINPNGKAWIGKDSNAIAAMQLDIGKTAQPLTLWGMECSYTIPELESSILLNRPVDSEKLTGIQLKHQMDTDEQVYIGDATLGYAGLLNNTNVVAGNVVDGAGGGTQWATKTPLEILADVNTLINSAWQASGWAQIPDQLRLPPAQFSLLNATLISSSGNKSILDFIRENNLARANGVTLNIQPLKWLIGAGAGGTPGQLGTVDRMLAYTKNPRFVRFPMVPLQRTPLEYRSIFHITTYFGRLGVVEVRYPETVQYADGI